MRLVDDKEMFMKMVVVLIDEFGESIMVLYDEFIFDVKLEDVYFLFRKFKES